MLSANNLHWLLRPLGKSLTYIKNKRGPRMERCGTPTRISTQEEHWPFKTTLCFLLVKKSFSALIRSPHTLSVKNPSVKSDEFLPWWRIFFTDEIFYRRIFFTDELVFLFGQYFAF